MSQSLASFPHPRSVAHAHGQARALGLGVLLGLIVGVLAFAFVETTIPAVRAALSSKTSTVVAEAPAPDPTHELPREWRWERKPVEYEHMYRKQESPRLDWIRDGGKR